MTRLFCEPRNGFGGEAVEGLDGEDEVFFFGVFDFVVGDAVEGLDEEHDGGGSGAADFGGVVEWAGGEAVGGGDVADFFDGLCGEVDEVGVEGEGLDLPDFFPGDGDVFFGGDLVAGGLGLGVHLGEGVGV